MASDGTVTARRRSDAGPAIRGRLATFVVLIVTAMAIVGAAYLSNGGTQAGGGFTPVNVAAGQGEPPAVGRTAPDFTATDDAGLAVSLSALRGRPVWLTFGASWCQSCRAENPDIEEAWRSHAQSGVAVVGVFLSEDAAAVHDYSTRVSLSYVRLPDPASRLASQYRIVGLPTHFFIDRDGTLRQIRIGSLTPEAMEAALREIGG